MPSKHPFSKLSLGGFEAGGFPLVEFDRKPFDKYPVRGFAIDWKEDLTLFQDFDTELFQLNGWAVFRNSDIRRYRAIPEGDFLARAIRLQKIRPAMSKGVAIGSLREAAESAGAKFPLLTVHRERIKQDVCYVGKFGRATTRTLTMREISPQAEWEDEETFAFRDITKLEFGAPTNGSCTLWQSEFSARGTARHACEPSPCTILVRQNRALCRIAG